MTNEELITSIQTGTDKRGGLLSLYNQNTGLIRRIARRFSGYIEAEDAAQEAFIIMARAAEEYRPGRGARFSSFFETRLQWHYIRLACSARLSAHYATAAARYVRFIADFRAQYGTAPDECTIQACLNITERQLRDLLQAMRAAACVSFDAPIQADGDGDTIGDLIPAGADDIEAAAERISAAQDAAKIWQAVDELEPARAAVIRDRFKDGRTVQETAAAEGIAPGAVTSLQRRGLADLRRNRTLQGIAADYGTAKLYRGGLQRFRQTGQSIVEETAIKHLSA